jgi:hypothetical protein
MVQPYELAATGHIAGSKLLVMLSGFVFWGQLRARTA